MAKILVVDDEESIRFTFRSFLSDEGHAVETGCDYDEALAKIGETSFDLVFSDIVLGDRTGIDVLRAIREKNLACPVVIITGYPKVDTASEAVRLGAFDYITKPVRQEMLLRLTRRALEFKAVNDEKERYRANLEAIFRSVKDAIITVDEDLRVLELNKAAREVCDFSREAIGRHFASLRPLCGDQCLRVLEETIRKREAVEVSRVECDVGSPGQVVSLSASPLLDRKGVFCGAVLVVRDETRLAGLERELGERRQFLNIIGKSERMQAIYGLIEDLASVETTVLITGESGTGKELVAEALHYKGRRSDKPLVKVNCSALSENLLESELFGHVKGAFTGAVQDKVGRFKRADGGTIFLDEIGDVSSAIQQRLLRVIQEKEFERVGDSTSIKVDVRVVTATNKDLRAKVKSGEFREDLYYRLKVMEIALPPLRERREDIPLLLEHFLKKFRGKLRKEIVAISEDVQTLFMDYPWPGNVRELENTLEHAFILCRGATITVDHLPASLKDFTTVTCPSVKTVKTESEEILEALEKTGWNKVKAAKLLGISRRTIYRKIDEYKLARENRE